MFYMKANRNHNGCLSIDTIAGFVDDSKVLNEGEFLKEITTTTHIDDAVYGLVSVDVHSVLLAAY